MTPREQVSAIEPQVVTAYRYQYATQKLINLKWELTKLEFFAPANSAMRDTIHALIGGLQEAVNNLLSDDFQFDPSTFDTKIPKPHTTQENPR